MIDKLRINNEDISSILNTVNNNYIRIFRDKSKLSIDEINEIKGNTFIKWTSTRIRN